MHPIVALKKLMSAPDDLNEPLNYFLSLMERKILFKLEGHRTVEQVESREELLAVIHAVEAGISQRLGKPIWSVNPTFFEIPGHHFYHGICVFPDLPLPLTVLYFSDIQIGLFALTGVREPDVYRFALTYPWESMTIH